MAKQKVKNIIKVKVSTSVCLIGQQNDAFQSCHAWSWCSVKIWKGSAHVSEPGHIFSLTKLSFCKWPNWPPSENWVLWGWFCQFLKDVIVRQSLTLDSCSLDRCFEKREVLISRRRPSNGAKPMVMMSPRHHPSVLPLWFLIPRIVLMFVHPRDVLKPRRWFSLLSFALCGARFVL